MIKGTSTPFQRIVELLGPGTFIVPCEWGTKKPLLTYVERPFESTQSVAYRTLCEQPDTNLAVYLGKASGGLCAIDCDSDEDLAAFLAVNPLLASTTRSRGSRGGMVWVRIVGDYPASCSPDHHHFEWRADKRLSTIHGRHPKGMDYQIVVEAVPVALPFAEIIWPEGWALPWVTSAAAEAREALAREFGQPFYTNKDGKVTGINERFWAGLYAREHRILFDPDDRTFWRYEADDGIWHGVTVASIREAVSARILEVSRESAAFTLEIQITVTKLNSVIRALEGIAERRGVFQGKRPFVHVDNGVIRFKDDGEIEFGGFSPEDYSRNRSPYAFDAMAECPRFLSDLILPAVNPDDADLLQRWFGLALYGYNLPQRFLILDGTPKGGKSTLVRIAQALVGVQNTAQLRTEVLTERFETFRYRGRTLLIGSDVPGDFLQQKGASVIKSLVGGDSLDGEGKGLNGSFQMFGTFNIVVTCNSRLRLRLDGDAGAWRRRLLIVRFEQPPPPRAIPDFDRLLLREEGAGILRWALAGFVQLQEEFADIGDFALTEPQRKRIDSLLAESESLRVFLTERVSPHDYGDVTTAELMQAYAEFCGDRGWNPLPVTLFERQVGDLMMEIFHRPKSHDLERNGKKSNRGWHGVRLLAVNAEEDA